MAPNPTTDLQELAGNAEVATNLTLGLSLGGFVTPDPNENKMVTSLPPVTSPAMLQLVRRNDSSSSIKMEEKFRMMKKWQNLVKRESNEKMAARSDIMKIEGGANVGGGGGGGLGLVVTPIRKTVGPVGAWPLVVNVNSGPQRISTSSGGSSGGGSDMQGLGASGLSNSGDVQSPSIQPPSPTKKACFESKQDGRLVTKKPQTEARRNGLTESEDRRKELTETEVRRDVLTETGAGRNGPRETMKTLMEEMPSVYTKGRGGRIEGFIYKYKKRDVSIVCLCHGKFFTPKEFVEHAGGRDVAVPSRHIFITP